MFNQKQKIGIAIATAVLIVASGIGAYALRNQVLEMNGSRQYQPAQTDSDQEAAKERGLQYAAKQQEYVGRIKNGDKTAIDEYSAWIKSIGGIAASYASGTYVLFREPPQYKPYDSTSTLVIVGKNGLKTIDLGWNDMDPLGVTPAGELVYEPMTFHEWEQYSYPSMYTLALSGNIFRINSSGEVRQLMSLKKDTITFFGQAAGKADVTLPVTVTERDMNVSVDGVLVPLDHDNSYGAPLHVGYYLKQYLLSGSWDKIEFYTQIDHFGSAYATLQLRPVLKLDDVTRIAVDCSQNMSSYMAGIKQGIKEDLNKAEVCAKAGKYSYKKLAIPGTSDYYGFFGNNSGFYGEEAACVVDGTELPCMLYKVQNGKTLFIDSSDGNRLDSDSLRDIEPIKVQANGDLLIHRFPYEICLFHIYENYDYVHNTSTGVVVDYEEGGTCGDKTTLTFYPNHKAISFTIEAGAEGAVSRMTLSYNGKAIGSFTQSVEEYDGGHLFPNESELKTYALQSDKTKFSFTTASSSYVLDLASNPPKLMKK